MSFDILKGNNSGVNQIVKNIEKCLGTAKSDNGMSRLAENINNGVKAIGIPKFNADMSIGKFNLNLPELNVKRVKTNDVIK